MEWLNVKACLLDYNCGLLNQQKYWHVHFEFEMNPSDPLGEMEWIMGPTDFTNSAEEEKQREAAHAQRHYVIVCI